MKETKQLNLECCLDLSDCLLPGRYFLLFFGLGLALELLRVMCLPCTQNDKVEHLQLLGNKGEGRIRIILEPMEAIGEGGSSSYVAVEAL